MNIDILIMFEQFVGGTIFLYTFYFNNYHAMFGMIIFGLIFNYLIYRSEVFKICEIKQSKRFF